MTGLLRRRRAPREDGFTLIELLATMALFSIFLAIFGAAVTTMLKDVRKTQGNADGLDSNRRVMQLVDKQLRYANHITAPGVGADGNYYVEWMSGNAGVRQTCTQWRLDRVNHRLQVRSWKPKLVASDTLSATPPGWTTKAFKAYDPAPTAARPSGVPFDRVSNKLAQRNQTLNFAFITKAGAPATRQSVEVTLSAINADTTKPGFSEVGICGEYARS
jgi:prepilin-type N-terminal cleavage/methylation domain-containing protein